MLCQICKKEFDTLKSFNRHLKPDHGFKKQEHYYYNYLPRTDLLTGEQIPFKDAQSYLKARFINKQNMMDWFRANSDKLEAKKLAMEILKDRKEDKGQLKAFCQVELRTINSPSIIGLTKLFGSYDSFLKQLGMEKKFEYENVVLLPTQEMQVLIDTREQAPIAFESSKSAKLDSGDYTVCPDFYADVYIERKSINDFFSTFYTIKNYDRFKKELKRATDFGFYLIVCIEAGLNSCLSPNFNFVRDVNLASHTFKNVRDLIASHDNIQFVFCKSRAHLKNVMLSIFSQKEKAKNYDWQYLVDMNII